MKKLFNLLLVLLSFKAIAQEIKINEIEFNNISIKEALEILEKKIPNKSFTYNNNLKVLHNKVNKSYQSKTLNEILNDLLKPEGVSYRIIGDNIIIYLQSDDSKRHNNKTFSGYIYDENTGEALLGANIYSAESLKGVAANYYGFFSLEVPKEETTILISHIGYADKVVQLKASTTRQNILLATHDLMLDEVIVSGFDNKLEKEYAGALNISAEKLKKLPLFLGEPDIIKGIQLQNGIRTITEGSSFYYVRGGNHDQNLVLIDEAPLYNPSHILGLVSVINGDAIKKTSFYKGYFPSKYAGRISSVMDITTNDGNLKELNLKGGVSAVGARAVIDGPIVKDKASFMISGRKSFVDLFLKKSLDAVPNYYDINAKTHWRVNKNNNLYLSAYHSNDKLELPDTDYVTNWSNTLGTLRWNHIYNNKLFSNTSLIYNHFNSSYRGLSQNRKWVNGIDEVRLKYQLSYYLNNKNKLVAGIRIGDHAVKPGEFDDNSLGLTKKRHRSYGIFASHRYDISKKFRMEYGVHFKTVQALGNTRLIDLDNDYNVIKTYNSGTGVYKTWIGLEPRLNLMYHINDNNRVFASFSRMQQFIHSLNNSQNDYDFIKTWIPVSNNVDPLYSNIYSVGYNLKANNLITLNIEGYYKNIENQLDYIAYPKLQNINYETELRAGKANSYGVELGVGYQFKKLKLQLDYSYSKTKFITPGINNGKSYVAPYDIPHQLTINGLYQFNYRWSFSGLWKFSSGRPFTLPVGTQLLGGGSELLPIYGNKYNARGMNFHKLDFMITLGPKKSTKKWKGTLNVGVSNAYGQSNPLTYSYTGFRNLNAESYDFFKFLPTLSYNFKL